jgi:hypothetical protein
LGKSKHRIWNETMEHEATTVDGYLDTDDAFELGEVEEEAKVLLEDAKTAVAKLYQKTSRRSRFDKMPRKVNDWQ